MDLKQAQERIAVLEADNTALQASNKDLTTKLTDVTAELTKFSADRRASDVKQLYTDLTREYKDDDADVKAFSTLPQAAFESMASVKRSQFSTTAKVVNPLLFEHAVSDSGRQEPTDQSKVNPLLANATARAAQFKR